MSGCVKRNLVHDGRENKQAAHNGLFAALQVGLLQASGQAGINGIFNLL